MFSGIIDWLSTSSYTGEAYHTLLTCLQGDIVLMVLIYSLCTVVLAGYIKIYRMFLSLIHEVEHTPAAQTFRRLADIFLYCGLSGYGFTLVSMFFPVWKIQPVLLLLLAYATWDFILRKSNLLSIRSYFECKIKSLESAECTLQEIEKMTEERKNANGKKSNDN